MTYFELISYIDLVLVHYPRSQTRENEDELNASDRRESFLALEKLKEEGPIRSVGVSNYETQHLEEIRAFGKAMPAVNQVEFHPHFARTPLRDYCKKEGVFFQAYRSLGKQQPELIEDPTVKEIAVSRGLSPQVILLAWPVNLGVGIVPKSSNPERIAGNMEAAELTLTEEEMTSLSLLDRGKNYVWCEPWNVL